MSTTNQTTLPEYVATSDAPASPHRTLGLVVIGCSCAPKRLGGWIPVERGTWIFGRGHALDTDAFPRLSLYQQLPGANASLTPFEIASLSRVQLLVTGTDSAQVDVQRIGQATLRINGRVVDGGTLTPGDVMDVGTQLSFLCQERVARLPHVVGFEHPFGSPDPHGIVGESPAIWRLRAATSFAAQRSGHVLVHGNSGTGKELVARAVHAISKRAGALVSRSAATFPEALVDAELFGNAEGYPNTGMRARPGLVGAADRGTLFLDEFGELPVSSQTHLLRVLDAGEYHRLGEAVARRADLRLIAATNQPFGRIRDDVLARFAFVLEVPGLESRREDIPLLIRHLLGRMNDQPEPLTETITSREEPPWLRVLVRELIQNPPTSNVRGVRSGLWRAMSTSEQPSEESTGNEQRLADRSETDLSANAIHEALNANDGSLQETWKALGLSSRFALMRLMKKHGIRVARRASAKT